MSRKIRALTSRMVFALLVFASAVMTVVAEALARPAPRLWRPPQAPTGAAVGWAILGVTLFTVVVLVLVAYLPGWRAGSAERRRPKTAAASGDAGAAVQDSEAVPRAAHRRAA